MPEGQASQTSAPPRLRGNPSGPIPSALLPVAAGQRQGRLKPRHHLLFSPLRQRVLPNPQNVPTGAPQREVHLPVARAVRRDLVVPKFPVRFRPRVTPRTPVPETAVDKHRQSPLRKNEIRFSEQRTVPPPAGDAMRSEDRDQTQLGCPSCSLRGCDAKVEVTCPVGSPRRRRNKLPNQTCDTALAWTKGQLVVFRHDDCRESCAGALRATSRR